MRPYHYFFAVFLFALCAFAKDQTPMLVSHNDITGPLIGKHHTEDLQIFSDGRVKYEERGNDPKDGTFESKLSPRKLQKLTALLNSKSMRAIPANIPSQIKVVEFDWEKKMQIHRGTAEQSIVIQNFYPLLNAHKPAYPKVLIQVECMLQDIQRDATKRPPPPGDQDWCPEVQSKR
jgi:uncharacterized protein DUF6438